MEISITVVNNSGLNIKIFLSSKTRDSVYRFFVFSGKYFSLAGFRTFQRFGTPFCKFLTYSNNLIFPDTFIFN